ncbi:hypothetical protein EOI86_13445 [Hwanghaeella grinnelliae]|uniref:Uncharacterized protein n=1 Tax=Hwanghaeella grinnelliae TaxID=2500179 RepID=A0A437QNV8_9PROT|nr:hypothetical protein [Hwanghaeella grinnelliae]RVU36221.1 hypothetical protein EOI86_13445 [Hwanghaeella grinnelliae]
MSMLLNERHFPSVEHSVRAHWAPILLRPISGSIEQLVVGVATANAEGFHVELANALDRLQCLYGPDATGAIKAVELAGEHLEHDLSKRSVEALFKPDSIVTGVFVGECMEAEGLSLESLAQSWMTALSSLYVAPEEHYELVAPMSVAIVEDVDGGGEGDRLPFMVCDYIKSHRDGYGVYFSADLQAGRPRRAKGSSSKVIIDFAGPKLVANFGTLRAGSLTSSVHRIKRRLWDLKVDRDKEPNVHFARAHEMMLHRPSKDDPQVTERQQNNIDEALEELEAQADQEELRLLAFENVQAIGKRILDIEVAA